MDVTRLGYVASECQEKVSTRLSPDGIVRVPALSLSQDGAGHSIFLATPVPPKLELDYQLDHPDTCLAGCCFRLALKCQDADTCY